MQLNMLIFMMIILHKRDVLVIWLFVVQKMRGAYLNGTNYWCLFASMNARSLDVLKRVPI